jgi:two-component system, LytTR family, response regulator
VAWRSEWAVPPNRSIAGNVQEFVPRVQLPESRRLRASFRAGDRTFYPRIDEVIRIEARRNYSEVFLVQGSFMVREVLVSIERRLARWGFFRIRRSAIVNLDHVVEIRRERRGRYAVVLTDGSSVTVPAAVKDRIETLLAVD